MLAGMDADAGASTHHRRMNGSTNAQTQRQERSACIASWAAAGLGRAAEGTQPCTRRQADCQNVPQQNVPQQSQRVLCRVERVRMCLSRLGIRGDRTGGGGADHARDPKLELETCKDDRSSHQTQAGGKEEGWESKEWWCRAMAASGVWERSDVGSVWRMASPDGPEEGMDLEEALVRFGLHPDLCDEVVIEVQGLMVDAYNSQLKQERREAQEAGQQQQEADHGQQLSGSIFDSSAQAHRIPADWCNTSGGAAPEHQPTAVFGIPAETGDISLDFDIPSELMFDF